MSREKQIKFSLHKLISSKGTKVLIDKQLEKDLIDALGIIISYGYLMDLLCKKNK